MKRTIAELDKESIMLQEYLSTQKTGAELSYIAIEHGSAVKMDQRGRAHLRRCMHRMKIEYSCSFGYGIKLADPGSVMPILSTRIHRIDRAVKRGDRSQKILQEQFFESLPADQQKQVLFAGAIFGAIRLASEQGRTLYKKRTSDSFQVHIDIPKLA
jgi:hypothetical protein